MIREVGPEDGVPTSVVIEFSQPISSGGRGTGTTQLELEPRVPGTLVFSGPSTLTFTPSAGFKLATDYRVRLAAVETSRGILRPSQPDAWSYSFRTPELAFVRHALTRVSPKGGELALTLTFSGPVDAAAVKKLSRFQVNGEPLTDARFAADRKNPTHVNVTLSSGRLKPGAKLSFTLQPGLVSTQGGGRAKGAELELALPGAKRLDVLRATLREGGNGYYVDIACREVAPESKEPVLNPADVPDPEWDEYDYGSRENRCTLDETEALSFIRTRPSVKLSIAPSRRGFRVFGDFKRGPHTLTVDSGLVSKSGALSFARFEKVLSVPARKPQLSFGATGRYLPRSAWNRVAITHLNVEKVELEIRHIPPENLVFWLSDANRETADERTSNLIAKKTVALASPPDTRQTTQVQVADLVPSSTRGVVEISAQINGMRSATRLLLTDLSLVAKRTKQGEAVRVWALGMESNELLSGVAISLVKKSGQTVATCTTSAERGCELNAPAGGADPSAPFAIIARKGDELTYLRYQDLKTEITESDIQGEPYRTEKPYRATLYTDRGVYRPGDTAHLMAVTRTDRDVAPPSGLPVVLELMDPRQRSLLKRVLKTNEAGLLSLDIPFEAYATTGVYQAKLSVADRVVATHALNVEEFVPERMKVTARTERAAYPLGESVPVNVEAAYLFGGSAAKSAVEASCRLESSLFRPKLNANYQYGIFREGVEKPVTLGAVKETLDEKGQARLECPAPPSAGGIKGPARLVSQVAVFEAGSGRSTQSELSVPVHPERFYLGLQSGSTKLKAGQAFKVSGVVVDWNGAPLTGAGAPKKVEVELLRLEREYGYYWDESEGSERYQHHLRSTRESTSMVEVGAQGTFSAELTPNEPAEAYLVRVRRGNAQSDLKLDGEWSGAWWTNEAQQRDQTPKPLRPQSLPLELRAQGKVGEPIEVKIKAPFRGRVLFTAETDEVLAAEWRTVSAGEQSWSFTPKTFVPNLYVSAFLVKDPHLESTQSFMPDRAFGVTSVKLEPTSLTQAVTLEVPQEVRSHSTLNVTINAGSAEAGTYATVAAVDEGILQLTRFPSPDPLAQLYSQRALGVETYETLGWTLLVPPQGNSRETGGDQNSGSPSGRVQPVKPVALWSGLVKLNAQGRAKVSFEVPQYRGALRVMVVTASAKRIGHASAQVTVRDPLTIQTTLPRFLSQGDQIEIPVFVTNVSGKPLDVKVALTSENLPVPGLTASAVTDSPLQLLGKPEGQARLEDGKSATLVFQAKATKAIGAARLSVTAEGGGFVSKDSLDVPFSPSGPRERSVQKVELAQGALDLKPLLQGWLPTTERSTFWVTSNPYGESFDHLKFLIEYPYGCIEQTTSSTRPMLFVSSLIESVDPTALGGQDLEAKVAHGIARVLSMQTSEGGFSYWPGAQEPVAWGTAYASHMLLDAQKAGFPVPQDRLDDALKWAATELDRWENGTAIRSGHYQDHEGDAEPYLHYVMALTGKGRKAAIQKAIDRIPRDAKGKSLEHLYLLKAALYLAGDRHYEQDLRNPDTSPIERVRQNSWDFYSDQRRRGLMLSTFQDLFGSDARGEPLANLVADSLKGRPSTWYNTQELVWSVTGLGKRLGTVKADFQPPLLWANGKQVETKPNPRLKSSDRSWALARASEYGALKVELPKKGEAKVYAVVSSEGVRQNGQWKLGGEGLAVRRTFRQLSGESVDPLHAPVALAQLLFVEIEVRNTSGARIQNLALVDRLPAGFEIENPRLGRGAGTEWMDPNSAWTPDHLNVRDDRVEVFGALEAGQSRTFTYAVRAVTSGKFTLPPVEIEAMYNPALWARQSGGEVTVTGPWKDLLL